MSKFETKLNNIENALGALGLAIEYLEAAGLDTKLVKQEALELLNVRRALLESRTTRKAI